MKTLSSSASISNFLNANDDLSDDDFSLERCADKQASILHQGKRIEKFIKNWAKGHQKDTCYKLLCILFDLFKSEVSSNINLREALMKYKTDQRLYEEYDKQLTRLFKAVKKYDPKIQSLTEIFSLFQRKIIINSPEELSDQVFQAKDELAKLNQEAEQKRSSLDKIQKELSSIQRNFDEEMVEKNHQLQISKEEEYQLQRKLNILQKEITDLLERQEQLKKEENPQSLKETIEHIDERLSELQTKIQVVTKNHKNKVSQYKSKISKYESSVLDLRNDKSTIEAQLDQIHQEIDIIINPFTNVRDENKSPQFAQVKLIEVKKEYAETQKIVQEEQDQIDILTGEVEGLDTTLSSLKSKMDRYQKTLSDLQIEFDAKEKILIEIEEKRKVMKEIAHKKREIDEIKKHVESENLRLNQELESAKERYKNLAIDNDKLLKDKNFLDLQRRELLIIQKQNILTEDDIEKYNHVSNSYQNIKESLQLPSNMEPSQITDAILHQLP